MITSKKWNVLERWGRDTENEHNHVTNENEILTMKVRMNENEARVKMTR